MGCARCDNTGWVAVERGGVRRVERISEIAGMEDVTPQLQDIFVFEQTGRRGRNVEGRFVATGIVPQKVLALRSRGIEVPLDIFRKGTGGGP